MPYDNNQQTPMSITVPFSDLHAQYLSIKPAIDSAIHEVIRTSAFIRGPMVERFELEFASALGVRRCVSCANGTDALYIAMHALGVRPGSEVITTAHSWISTSEAITQSGGRVVFCDTDANTYTIDPSQIEAKITPNTAGIIPVHLYGQPADMDPILAIAQKHRLWVIEDCAQAHMARYKGKMVGSFGRVGCFSFYPGKNLGAMGDAGALVTNDVALADQMAMFARHGGLTKGDHQIEGINSRLDGMQAAILSVKLPQLSKWTERRQQIASSYTRMLVDVPGVCAPFTAHGREHVFHLYVIQHPRRNELAKHLLSKGVQTAINYPTALPFLPAYERLGHEPKDFPNASRNQSRILSLPMFSEMTSEQQMQVVETIRSFKD
jgi:dTDP-4-amino-4,6-dideoxygalactose transaminase